MTLPEQFRLLEIQCERMCAYLSPAQLKKQNYRAGGFLGEAENLEYAYDNLRQEARETLKQVRRLKARVDKCEKRPK